MYDYISGKFVGKNRRTLTVEAGGIGYLLELAERDFNVVQVGEEGKIYTVLLHREDKMSLCGFIHREARDIFNILMSASGIGPKMALVLLNEFTPTELIGLVIDGDHHELTRAKGVGGKLAQKIILELKDKLINYQTKEPANVTKIRQDDPIIEDVQAVLASLGYGREEIKAALAKSASGAYAGEMSAPPSAEMILKSALKILSN